MKRDSRALKFCTALLLLISGVAFAQTPTKPAPAAKRNPSDMSIADITSCMRANVVDRGSLREIQMLTTDREGKQRKLKMKLFWKATKDTSATRATLRVVEPADQAGAAYLAVTKPEGDEVYLYMPALDRVQRVVGDENRALFGTDFTYSDVKQVQALLEKGTTQRLANANVAERAVFVLDTATDAEATGYTHIRSYVDDTTCTLLKAEFFTQGSEPHKVLEADLSKLVEVDPWWLILGYTMRDLRAGTRTELGLSDVYLQERLPEDLFDPASFYRVEP